MLRAIDAPYEIFNFTLMTPLCYAGKIDIIKIEKDLLNQGLYIFTSWTNPNNFFFREIQKQMLYEDPTFEIKLIILTVRYNNEFTA